MNSHQSELNYITPPHLLVDFDFAFPFTARRAVPNQASLVILVNIVTLLITKRGPTNACGIKVTVSLFSTPILHLFTLIRLVLLTPPQNLFNTRTTKDGEEAVAS